MHKSLDYGTREARMLDEKDNPVSKSRPRTRSTAKTLTTHRGL